MLNQTSGPGTQRVHDEAPPMARRDVGFTHSVDVRDRSDRSDSVEQTSVASEGLERYNGVPAIWLVKEAPLIAIYGS